MESIENFHAERVRQPLFLASWEEVRARGTALDLTAMPRLSGSVLDPRAPFLWLEGHEILGRTSIWLPFELVHTAYTLPLPTGSGAFQMNDSGVASGNHPLEATSHAICELVERDAVSLWTYSTRERQQACKVDVQTIEEAACQSVLEKFAAAGICAGIWDVTTDTGIPTFVCMIADEPTVSQWRPIASATGSGCHPCRGIALLRALTEAAQTRLTVIAGSRDDLSIATYRRGHDPTIAAEAIGMITEAGAGRSFGDGPSYVGATFHDDVAWEIERLRACSIEQIAVVDLALPELQIPVVRVVIPGLEGIAGSTGFSPGKRLLSHLS
jgi:ribosomal protein S12 methylthiotransferase accessory factor